YDPDLMVRINGVMSPNHEPSMPQKAAYNASLESIHYDNHNKIPNGIEKTESSSHPSANFINQASTQQTFNDLDALNQSAEINSLRESMQKTTINGHFNQTSDLLLNKPNSPTSPLEEPSGLDILSQVAQDFGNMLGRRAKLSQRVNQRLTTLRPVKFDENLSKL